MGSLRWNGLTGVVSIYKVGDTTWQDIFTHTPQYDDSYIAEWKNFLECVGEGKTPSVTGLDGLKVIQIVEAVRKSASANGQMFKLEKMVVAPSQFYYCRD